jgi:outer membrane protein TolC
VIRRSFLLAALLAGCASARPPEPGDVPFARVLLARESGAVAPETGDPVPTPALPPGPEPGPATDGIVPGERISALRAVAENDGDIASRLREPLEPGDLAALAVLRSPEVRAARARVEAARTAYRQSTDLADLLATYRAFAKDTRTRVGPRRSRPDEMPGPYPGVSSISGEIAHRALAIAHEDLRAAVLAAVASAERVHADGARLVAARRILEEDVALHDALLEVTRARYESGGVSQAGFLAFRSRREELETERAVLVEKEAVVRARLNRLLSRPDDAPANIAFRFGAAAGAPPEQDAVARALASSPVYRKAVLVAERATLAVRLAETMTLPRFDLGASRAMGKGEMMPRATFGVKEAQVTEMRARREAAEAGRAAARDLVRTRVREALFAVAAADRRREVRESEVVPLARRSLESVKGSYEGNRVGYLDLLDAARRLLKARLGLLDARRDFAHARADLLVATGGRVEKERAR